jgi:hypothetical protein
MYITKYHADGSQQNCSKRVNMCWLTQQTSEETNIAECKFLAESTTPGGDWKGARGEQLFISLYQYVHVWSLDCVLYGTLCITGPQPTAFASQRSLYHVRLKITLNITLCSHFIVFTLHTVEPLTPPVEPEPFIHASKYNFTLLNFI